MFKKLFESFQKNGMELYHVGGSVRDILLHIPPKDFDFCTNALPDQTQKILTENGFKNWPIGQKFGTIAAFVYNPKGIEQQIEITTYRKDITSGRHPEVVFTGNLISDLERRDFTINSIVMDSTYGVVDPLNGKRDINNKLIRATGNPYERFSEDPLRMLRAIRFASKLNFQIEKETWKAIQRNAQLILTISRERWLEEMNKILITKNIKFGLDLLKHSRLLFYMIPEIMPVCMEHSGSLPSKDLWLHTITVVEKSTPITSVRWAALLHDIGKPQTRIEIGNEVHFFQHENLGAEIVEGIARRFKMGNGERKNIKGLVALHQRIGDAVSRKNNPPVSLSALRRIIRECEECGCDIVDLINLFRADCSSKKPEVLSRQMAHADLLFKAFEEINEEMMRPRLPSGIGTVIIEKLHLSPGPEVGKVKQVLDEWLLDGKIPEDWTAERMIDFYLANIKTEEK